MFALMVVLIIIASIFLIIAVLLQPGKGDLSATFGGFGGQMGSMFGMQRTKDIMSRVTQILAIIIFVFALLVNRFFVSGNSPQTQQVKPITEGAKVPANNLAPPPVQNPQGQAPAPR
jgi:preprotein translocase subunit SecG